MGKVGSPLYSSADYFGLVAADTNCYNAVGRVLSPMFKWTVTHANKKVLKIALHTKRRPWFDCVFAQIKNTSPPFQYSKA